MNHTPHPSPNAPRPRDSRPVPVLLHDGSVVVHGSSAAELAAALDLLLNLLMHGPRPASLGAAKLPASVRAIHVAARVGAVQYQAQRHADRAAWAAATVQPLHVVASSQTERGLEVQEEVTTSEAADIAGMSSERWRQLAAAGKVRARQGPRRAWLLNRADVVAYTPHNRQETADDRHEDRDAA